MTFLLLRQRLVYPLLLSQHLTYLHYLLPSVSSTVMHPPPKFLAPRNSSLIPSLYHTHNPFAI